jgi:hypothetical protein
MTQRVFRSIAANIVATTAGVLLNAAPIRAQDLPPARDLISRFVTVTGAAAWRGHQSARMRADMDIVELGATAEYEVRLRFPSSQYTRVAIPDSGELLSGFVGEVAWSLDPVFGGGSQLLLGKALEAAKQESDAAAQFERTSPNIVSSQTMERTVMNSQPCYLVKHTWRSGRTSSDCFSVSDGLIVATTQTVNTPIGEAEITAWLSDYADVGGGFMRARTISQQMPNSSQVIRLTSWRWDDVTEDEVALPPAIKAMLPVKPSG